MSMRHEVQSRYFGTIFFLAVMAGANGTLARETDIKTNDFVNRYVDICMWHIGELEGLRYRYSANLPKLPQDQTKRYLGGDDGDAWLLQGNGANGNLVLSIRATNDICSINAIEASAPLAEELFKRWVEVAPPPFISKRNEPSPDRSEISGQQRVLSYIWSIPNEHTTYTFTLIISAKGTLPFQSIATVEVKRRD